MDDKELNLYWAYKDLQTLLRLRHNHRVRLMQVEQRFIKGRQVVHHFQEPDVDKVILNQIKLMEMIKNDSIL